MVRNSQAMCILRRPIHTANSLLEDDGFSIFKPGNFRLFPQGVEAIGPTEQDGGGAFWDTGVSGGRHEPRCGTVIKGIYNKQKTRPLYTFEFDLYVYLTVNKKLKYQTSNILRCFHG